MWLLKATGLALLTLGAAECREAGKSPTALLLPAPDPCKHGLFPYDAVATEGRLGTGKAAASAGQVLTVPSVMVPLCLSPVYDQPNLLGFVFFFLPPVSVHSAPPHLCSSLG